MLGVLLINKPIGFTSHDVVAVIRRQLGIRRIGHAGTLDPLASGLLVVAVGPATRFLQYLPLEPKVYGATFKFGQETTSYDAEGEVVRSLEVPTDLIDRIDEALPRFRGSIQQIPPIYSAIKKDGKPLYSYARKGEDVEINPRSVFIKEYLRGERNGDEIEFNITCSGGTYIRSLAHDLGQAVGCGAHISQLRRLAVGKFSVEDARDVNAVTMADVISLADALPPFPLIKVNDGQVDHIQHGRAVKFLNPMEHKLVGLLDDSGNVMGIGRVEDQWVYPEGVIPAEVYEKSL